MRISSFLRTLFTGQLIREAVQKPPDVDSLKSELFNFGLPPHLGSGFQSTLPPLYHYTTLAGFRGILETRRIWATNAFYLNDINESKHLWDVLTQRLTTLLASGRTYPKFDLEELLRVIGTHRDDDFFVASFSEARDSLSQWRAYSGSGGGVCVGFSSEALRTQWIYNPAGEPHWTGMQFAKVQYLDENDPELHDALERLLSGPRSSLMKALDEYGVKQSREQELVALLSIFHARFKDPAFKEEQEWRLSFKRIGKPMRHQQFRVRGSMLVPYIEAELNKGSKGESLVDGDFVKEIIVGPSPHAQLNVASVKQFMIANGMPDVAVVASKTPYRDW